MPHSIHLHGPWDVTKISGSDTRFSFTRRFGCPTNLEQSEKVFLVCELNEPLARISLNEKLLGENVPANDAFRFDITDRLESRNELVIEVERSAEDIQSLTSSTDPSAPERIHWGTAGSLTGKVRLEIEKIS